MSLRVLTRLPVLGLCGLLLPGVAAADYPRHMWTLTDDDLAVPLGAVVDVASGSDRTVYLLDTQNMAARPISAEGSELPWLGRQGEGPGEFMHPRVVAARPMGGCIILQDFHSPAVCLDRDGTPCTTVDIALIRSRFQTTVFMGPARIDDTGRLVAAAHTTQRPFDPMAPGADLATSVSVFRVGLRDAAATVLFSDREDLGDQHTVRYARDIGYYALRCWDADDAGRVIYADPEGQYRVFIGHPADGPSRTLALPEAAGDARALARRAKDMKRSPARVPRIADVQWLGRDRFLVKPTTAVLGPKIWQSGTIEVFDTAGKSYGRHELARDYNPEHDALFVRGGVLVVIRGGRSALMASLAAQTRSTRTPPPDTIIVEAYDLAVPDDSPAR